MSWNPRSLASRASVGVLQPPAFAGFTVFAALALSLLPGHTVAAPAFGFLQFKIEHNLVNPACLATGSCFLRLEEEDDPAGWLSQIRKASDLATLHWDRAVPWLVFDVDPPPGSDRVAY